MARVCEFFVCVWCHALCVLGVGLGFACGAALGLGFACLGFLFFFVCVWCVVSVVSEVSDSRLGVSAWGVCVCVPSFFRPADWCLLRPAPGLCFCDVARAPVVVATLVLLLADAFASCTCPAGGFLVWSLRLLSINLFLFVAA